MIYNTLEETDKQRAITRFNWLVSRGKKIELKVVEKRSLKQNNYLHLILSLLAMETGNTLEYAKEVFYKRAANKEIFIREKEDELIGKIEYLRSSADLTQEEFSLSIDRFRDWASQVAGVYLPAPNEDEFLESIEYEMSSHKQWI
jgi:hypothetical protein